MVASVATVARNGPALSLALAGQQYRAFGAIFGDYVLVGSRAWGIALSPDESTLYVTNGLSDDLSIIDGETMRVEVSIPVGRVPHTVRVDG